MDNKMRKCSSSAPYSSPLSAFSSPFSSPYSLSFSDRSEDVFSNCSSNDALAFCDSTRKHLPAEAAGNLQQEITDRGGGGGGEFQIAENDAVYSKPCSKETSKNCNNNNSHTPENRDNDVPNQTSDSILPNKKNSIIDILKMISRRSKEEEENFIEETENAARNDEGKRKKRNECSSPYETSIHSNQNKHGDILNSTKKRVDVSANLINSNIGILSNNYSTMNSNDSHDNKPNGWKRMRKIRSMDEIDTFWEAFHQAANLTIVNSVGVLTNFPLHIQNVQLACEILAKRHQSLRTCVCTPYHLCYDALRKNGTEEYINVNSEGDEDSNNEKLKKLAKKSKIYGKCLFFANKRHFMWVEKEEMKVDCRLYENKENSEDDGKQNTTENANEDQEWLACVQDEQSEKFDTYRGPLWRVKLLPSKKQQKKVKNSDSIKDSNSNNDDKEDEDEQMYKTYIVGSFHHGLIDGISRQNFWNELLAIISALSFKNMQHNNMPSFAVVNGQNSSYKHSNTEGVNQSTHNNNSPNDNNTDTFTELYAFHGNNNQQHNSNNKNAVLSSSITNTSNFNTLHTNHNIHMNSKHATRKSLSKICTSISSTVPSSNTSSPMLSPSSSNLLAVSTSCSFSPKAAVLNGAIVPCSSSSSSLSPKSSRLPHVENATLLPPSITSSAPPDYKFKLLFSIPIPPPISATCFAFQRKMMAPYRNPFGSYFPSRLFGEQHPKSGVSTARGPRTSILPIRIEADVVSKVLKVCKDNKMSLNGVITAAAALAMRNMFAEKKSICQKLASNNDENQSNVEENNIRNNNVKVLDESTVNLKADNAKGKKKTKNGCNFPLHMTSMQAISCRRWMCDKQPKDPKEKETEEEQFCGLLHNILSCEMTNKASAPVNSSLLSFSSPTHAYPVNCSYNHANILLPNKHSSRLPGKIKGGGAGGREGGDNVTSVTTTATSFAGEGVEGLTAMDSIEEICTLYEEGEDENEENSFEKQEKQEKPADEKNKISEDKKNVAEIPQEDVHTASVAVTPKDSTNAVSTSATQSENGDSECSSTETKHVACNQKVNNNKIYNKNENIIKNINKKSKAGKLSSSSPASPSSSSAVKTLQCGPSKPNKGNKNEGFCKKLKNVLSFFAKLKTKGNSQEKSNVILDKQQHKKEENCENKQTDVCLNSNKDSTALVYPSIFSSISPPVRPALSASTLVAAPRGSHGMDRISSDALYAKRRSSNSTSSSFSSLCTTCNLSSSHLSLSPPLSPKSLGTAQNVHNASLPSLELSNCAINSNNRNNSAVAAVCTLTKTTQKPKEKHFGSFAILMPLDMWVYPKMNSKNEFLSFAKKTSENVQKIVSRPVPTRALMSWKLITGFTRTAVYFPDSLKRVGSCNPRPSSFLVSNGGKWDTLFLQNVIKNASSYICDEIGGADSNEKREENTAAEKNREKNENKENNNLSKKACEEDEKTKLSVCKKQNDIFKVSIEESWSCVVQHHCGINLFAHNVVSIDGAICWSLQYHSNFTSEKLVNEYATRIADIFQNVADNLPLISSSSL